MVSVDDLIFQTHNPAEPLTRVSASDITCIVQAGFCTYRRYYQEEDAGRAKESRLSLFLDHTPTLLHDNTLNVFFEDWCVREQSTGNTHRIFYTSYQYLVRKNRDKKQYYVIMNYIGPDWLVKISNNYSL
jgi:hypothetical protein